jgi:Protein of unknown function (DUF2924)
MTSVEEQITALQTLDVPALAAKHVELFGKPPRFCNRILLWRRLAWEIQRRHYGGLSAKAKARLEQLVSEIQLPTEPPVKKVRAVVAKPRAPNAPTAGTTIARTWHGRELRVRVVDRGFEYEGKVYRSLSGVAREITGVTWSGPLFFGLREPRSESKGTA